MTRRLLDNVSSLLNGTIISFISPCKEVICCSILKKYRLQNSEKDY